MSERDAFLELISAFEDAVFDNAQGYASPEWLTKELIRTRADLADAFDRMRKERDEARSERDRLASQIATLVDSVWNDDKEETLRKVGALP